MRNATRIAFTALAAQIALVNGVASATEKFNVTPSVQQTLESAIAGFTGRSTIAIVNAAGVIQNQAEIVFSGSTMTVNGVATNPAGFLATLNAQLGGAATASFVALMPVFIGLAFAMPAPAKAASATGGVTSAMMPK